MTPIENARGYRHGINYWGTEATLQKYTEKVEGGDFCEKPVGWEVSLAPNKIVKTAGGLTIGGFNFLTGLLFKLNSLENLPPQTPFGVDSSSDVLSKLGCKVVLRKSPPVLDFSASQNGQNVECTVWHGIVSLEKNLCFTPELSAAMGGMALLPLGLLEKVKNQGLVLKDETNIISLIPGRLSGNNQYPDILLLDDLYYFGGESQLDPKEKEKQAKFWEVISKTQPVVICFT